MLPQGLGFQGNHIVSLFLYPKNQSFLLEETWKISVHLQSKITETAVLLLMMLDGLMVFRYEAIGFKGKEKFFFTERMYNNSLRNRTLFFF